MDAGKPGDSITKELSKKKLCGDSCSKELCNHRSCKQRVRSSATKISSVEKVAQKSKMQSAKGEANEVRATPGWERLRVQIDTGAIDTVGPKEISKAFEVKETEMSRRGIGYVPADVCSVKNYGEKEIVGYADDGEVVSMRSQRADVKKVLRSVHKMNL